MMEQATEGRKEGQVPASTGLGMRPQNLLLKPGYVSSSNNGISGEGTVSDGTNIPFDTAVESEWSNWIGQHVCVGGAKKGILRYFGPVEFHAGLWCGIELDELVGKNDGSVHGIKYFTCDNNYGIFAPVKKVQKIYLPYNLPHDFDSENFRKLEHTGDFVQAKSKLPTMLSKFSMQSSKNINFRNLDAGNSLSEDQKMSPLKTSFHNENETFLQTPSDPHNVPEISKAESIFQMLETHSQENYMRTGQSKVKGRANLLQKNTLTTDNNLNSIPVVQDQNQVFKMTISGLGSTSVKEKGDEVVYENILPQGPMDKLNSTFDMEYDSSLESENTTDILPPIWTHNSKEVDKSSEDLQYPREDSLFHQEEFLHHIKVQSLENVSDDNENFDDEGLSLDFEESLGILTPNQMKDFTLCSEKQTSLVTDFHAVMLPKSFSCDEMNELPEYEVVEDVTIEYRDISDQAPYISRNGGNTFIQQNNTSLPNEKVITKNSEESSEYLPEICSDKSDSTEQFVDETIETSMPSSFSKDEHKNLTPEGMHRNLTYGTESIPSQSFGQEIHEVFIPFGFQADNVEKVTQKQLLKKQEHSELPVQNDIFPKSDISDIEDHELSSVYLIQENSGSLVKNGRLAEDYTKLCEIMLSKTSDDIKNEGRLLNTCFLRQLNYQQSDTPDEKVLNIHETMDHCIGPSKMSNTKVFIPVKQDEQMLSRETSFVSMERPSSTFTIGSTDTGFQGDLDSEGMLLGEEYCMRFSTYSQDSGTLSLEPEMEQQLKVRSEFYSGEKKITSDETISEQQNIDFGSNSLDKQLGLQGQKQGGKTPKYEITVNSGHVSEKLLGYRNESTYQAHSMWENKMKDDSKELLRWQENKDISNVTTVTSEIKIEGALSVSLSTTPFATDPCAADTEKDKSISINNIINHTIKDDSENIEAKESNPQTNPKQGKDEFAPSVDKSIKNMRNEQHPPKKVKTPKKNVMSKIKAMIESTGKKSKTEETKKTSQVQKKSRWDAVTSKIKASMDEEKSKPKTKKDIKSRIDTNLMVSQQPQESKSPKCLRNKSKYSVNEGNFISSKQSAFSKSKNTTNSQGTQRKICTSPIILDSQDFHDESNLSSLSPSSTLNFTSSLSEAVPSRPPSEMSIASLISQGSHSSSRIVIHKQNHISSHVTRSVIIKPSVGKTNQSFSQKQTPAKKARPVASSVANSSQPLQASSTRNLSFSQQIQRQRRVSSQVQPKDRPFAVSSVPGERRKTQGENVQEIQRLEALCETRTKQLNWLKLQLKHATLGFDSFSVLIKYLTEELDAFSNPWLVNELQSTKEDLQKTETQLKQYQDEIEDLKRFYTDEIEALTEKLKDAQREEVDRLILKHEQELETLKTEHETKIVELTEHHVATARDSQVRHSSEIEALNKQHCMFVEELEKNFTDKLNVAKLSHEIAIQSLTENQDELQQQVEGLQHEKETMEVALKQDVESKIQWIINQNTDLKKEVESLKLVLEMRKAEIHNLRKENLKLKKDLEELPLAKEQVEKLKARNEDLQARVKEKVELERHLSYEQQKLKESYEKESKVNKRLSMEKEELQWKLKQTMEASILLNSSTDETTEIDRLDHLVKDHTLRKSPIRMSVFFDSIDGNTNHHKYPSSGPRAGRPLSASSALRGSTGNRNGSSSSPCTPSKKRSQRYLDNGISGRSNSKPLEEKASDNESISSTETLDLLNGGLKDIQHTPMGEISDVIPCVLSTIANKNSIFKCSEQDSVNKQTDNFKLTEGSTTVDRELIIKKVFKQKTFEPNVEESSKMRADSQLTTTTNLDCIRDLSSSTPSDVEQYDIAQQEHISAKYTDQSIRAGEQVNTTFISTGIGEVDGSWQGSMTSSSSSWTFGLDVGEHKVPKENWAGKFNGTDLTGSTEASDEPNNYLQNIFAPCCLAGESMIQECPRSMSESSIEDSPVLKYPYHQIEKYPVRMLEYGLSERTDSLSTLDDMEGCQQQLFLKETFSEDERDVDINCCNEGVSFETEI
ncbi:restin homolog isoform X2 [Limulus polyphemus]|uniref:Restin homolog isoform X2 n=1 Tax=Limulus polyphemus TaxID=6850 RepID=A0ABM1S0V0_LIMPO|nr:restin homolog isoform X2 [Limulus polyphemus]